MCVVLVLGMWQSNLGVHVSIIFQIIFLFGLLQNIEQSAPCSTSLLVFCFKYSSVYMSVPDSQSISLLHCFPLVTTSLSSESVSLFLFLK